MAQRKRKRERASDDAYNARRRFKREAERLEKQAAKSEGSFSERLQSVADELRNKANMLYANKEKPGEYRQDLIRQSESVRSMSEERQIDILLSSNLGQRIYAGTKNLWIDKDPNEREDAIVKAFGVRTILDVVKILENQLGDTLYSEDTIDNYDSIRLAIMEIISQL